MEITPGERTNLGSEASSRLRLDELRCLRGWPGTPRAPGQVVGGESRRSTHEAGWLVFATKRPRRKVQLRGRCVNPFDCSMRLRIQGSSSVRPGSGCYRRIRRPRAGQGTPHSADGKAWPPVFEGKATK